MVSQLFIKLLTEAYVAMLIIFNRQEKYNILKENESKKLKILSNLPAKSMSARLKTDSEATIHILEFCWGDS